jgi:hypothetical protein
MIPPLIVQTALEHQTQLIAITDHNASANAEAVIRAAEGSGITVLPGMELQTEEEVHVLCIFDTLEQLAAFQNIVDEKLPAFENRADFFGEQFVVDQTGDFIRREKQLLITSTTLSFEEAFEHVQSLEGLFIPAHINRQAYGLIDHLGFVPPELPIPTLEISRHITPDEARKKFPQIRDYPLIQNGDVHYLDDFLGATLFNLEKPAISELKKALGGQDGRHFQIDLDI